MRKVREPRGGNPNGEKTKKSYHRMEVARIPKQARKSARSRLLKLGKLLEGALTDDELQRAMSIVAGVVNRVSAGVRLEVADSVARRGEGIRKRAESDCDLHAAAELADVASDLRLEAYSLCDWRKEEEAVDVAEDHADAELHF